MLISDKSEVVEDCAPSLASGRQSQRFGNKSKVAPLPADGSTAGAGAGVGAEGGVSLMSDHLRARSPGRSGVAWPAHTIPARVKQLSWDERPQRYRTAHYIKCTFAGQRAGGARHGRDRLRPLRPHEPDRLLLTERPQHPTPDGSEHDRAYTVNEEPQHEYIPLQNVSHPHRYPEPIDMLNMPDHPITNSRYEPNQRLNVNCTSPENVARIRYKSSPDETKSILSFDSKKQNNRDKYPSRDMIAELNERHFNLATPNAIHPFSVASGPPTHYPVEIVPIQVISPRHRSPIKKQTKAKHPKTLPPTNKHAARQTRPEPIAYIPVKMNHPPLNPDFLSVTPKQTDKPRAPKRPTPPGRAAPPLEYISIPVVGNTSHYQTRPVHQSPSKQARNTEVPFDRAPSAPRLSSASIEASVEGETPPFASIDPRKLRAHRVSPLIFPRNYQRYRML
ncbi:unnamed protein product [Diatraea saccharalis]|uniref:Uncharacterized protein n=1 Tax=Diatraea saccharalis TaxID=40085 RepID=A0A9N9N0F7_9NEOP|nr:unnamed protein product [Diatraea saccharalis]